MNVHAAAVKQEPLLNKTFVEGARYIGQGGSGDFMLSSLLTYETKTIYFVKLYDNTVYNGDVYSGLTDSSKKTNMLFKVAPTRSNARFLNKFTVHGKKQRSAKHFAKSLNAVLIILRETMICGFSNNASLLFNKCMITRKTIKACNTILTYFAQNLKTTKTFEYGSFGDIYSDGADVANTEYIFKLMQQLAPTHSFIVSKVDKARFKNSRGKSGRYQMSLKYIDRAHGINYMFKYLKHSWNFSKESTYYRKYIDVVIKTVVRPNTSLGFVLGKKAFMRVIKNT